MRVMKKLEYLNQRLDGYSQTSLKRITKCSDFAVCYCDLLQGKLSTHGPHGPQLPGISMLANKISRWLQL